MRQLTDFYCNQCRHPLSKEVAMDENRAWCSHCEAAVFTSYFRFPAWIVGLVFVAIVCIAL